MQALHLTDSLIYRTDLPEPVVAENECMIRLSLAGICATDLELMKGYAGFSGIPGHEFVGVVEAVADEKDRHWLNRRVVGSINIGCNTCDTCLHDGPEHCPNRKVLGIRNKDGVFADYFTLPVRNLITVPDEVPDEAAVFTEPLAAAIRVLEQIESLDISNIAVVGPGRLGLLIGKLLSLAGHNVSMLGRSERSLKLPSQWQLNTGLVTHTPDNHFDCVVDATGHNSGFAQALRIVKPRGSLILKSTFVPQEPVDLTKVVVSEVNIIGSRCGPFAKALALLAEKAIAVESMIDGQYKLKEGRNALDHAARTGIRKIILKP
ncbi:MAG: MDR/zinc-dependent alcohol dehydrogenase-like family protein [Gammaproteobacteria bacterium]